MPNLYLLDAYALIFRSYYAFINRPIRNSKGLNTSAIYGFTNSLDEILRKEKPDYVAVVFDPPGPTFRNALYPLYKANRLETPEEIRASVPYIKNIITGYNIPVIEIEGFEADDVIGTLAKKAEKEGLKVFMVTPDKDFGQLVSENICIYKPARSGNNVEIVGLSEIKKIYNIDYPLQLTDILSLWGDASDNIPGAPGIGEKTAKELVSKYISVENIFNHVHELKGKQKDSLILNQAQVYLSKQLATININVPVNIDIEQLRAKSKDVYKLKKLFDELEFRGLSNRILSTDNSSIVQQGVLFPVESSTDEIKIDSIQRTIIDIPHKYHLCEDDDSVRNLVGILLKFGEICFDTETTGLNIFKSELVGISFAVKANEAWFIPFPHDLLKTRQRLELLRPVFEKSEIRFIGQNIKFDIQILTKYGLKVMGPLFDTMIAHYLIQPELKHNMDYLSEVYLQYKPISIEELIGRRGKTQKSMRDVDLEKIKDYAAEDADITKQLADIMMDELKMHNLFNLAENVEMPLIKVLAEMEQTGVKINVSELKKFEGVLNKEIEYVQEEIFRLAGMKFNIASPKQLGEVLFEHMKIPADIKKTKSGQYPTGEEILLSLKNENTIINKILDYRSLQKLLNTYVETLPELVNPTTGRIHTSFEQAWVSTGRLSSKNPNLQNIPIRDQRGREIRKAFIPADENYIFLSADYSQIELRIMAHLSKDKNMIEAFSQNMDIHTSTAANINSIPVNDVTREMRTKAKTANFGIIYGISSFGLSQRLGIPRKESAKLIEDYFKTYPNVKNYMNRSIQSAKDKGYVETIMGRRRYLPDIHSANALVRGMAERNAINAPIQGSAADIIKFAMVNIYKRINGRFKTKMILQVHDELLFDVYKPEQDSVKEIIKYEMENAITMEVPLIVEIGCGNNWLEAH